MGDAEQVIAEPDEVEEDVVGVHPPTLTQHNPWLVTQIFTSVTYTIAANGWYVVGLLILAYLVWIRIKPKVQEWKLRREEDRETAEYHKNPDKVLARERAVDAARRRMQEKYDREAELHADKMKEMEEKKRKDRIEDWERLQKGESSKNKSINAQNGSAAQPVAAGTKPSGKPRLRPEYNPMTGDVGGGSCRWRPSQARPSGGG